MYDFFVLGLIPGTNIQISFTMWMESLTLLSVSAYLARHIVRRRAYGKEIIPTIGAEFIAQPLPVLWTIRTALIPLKDNAVHLLSFLRPAPATEQDN